MRTMKDEIGQRIISGFSIRHWQLSPSLTDTEITSAPAAPTRSQQGIESSV